MEIRRARTEEAREIAEVWLRSRVVSAPAIPPPVHSDHEVDAWFANVVLASREVWVAEVDGTIVACSSSTMTGSTTSMWPPATPGSGSALNFSKSPRRSGRRG